MQEIIIVGGGASGLLASLVIKSALMDNANVTILERLDKVGKKILATGNGKCNFTNELMSELKYNNPEFVRYLLQRFGYNETYEYFEKLGLLSKVLNEGRVYPISELATSVLDVLRLEGKRLGVVEQCMFEVKKITPVGSQYVIESTRGLTKKADYVVLATGGEATSVLGSNGSGYAILKSHKINITKTLPGLVGFQVNPYTIKGLDGIRVKGLVIIADKKTKNVLWSESGEVIFKSDGISGIVIMQAATYLARRHANLSSYLVTLDLMPMLQEAELLDYFANRIANFPNNTNETLFVGLTHKLIGYNILKSNNIDIAGYLRDLTPKDLKKICDNLKRFVVDIKSTYDKEKAQVTVGGVDLCEVQRETLELVKMPNVYVTGELLDIDGECGGYNLQWAWTSGYIAGNDIVKKIQKKVDKNDS